MTSQFASHAKAAWHLHKRNRDGAEAEYRTILARSPADPPSLHFVLGTLRWKGKDEEALALAREALAVEPANFIALRNAACCAVALGRHQEAEAFVENALRAADHEPEGYRWIDTFLLAAWRFARLVKRSSTEAPIPEPPFAKADRELISWKEWARSYLESREAAKGRSPQ